MDVLHGITSGSFVHGRGFTEVVPVADPAAGAGFTYTVSGAYWERIAALSFTLVSDANAANRQVLLTVKDGEPTPLATVAAGGVQAASLTRTYTFLPNVNQPGAVAGGAFVSPCPYLILQTGFQVVLSIGSVQVTDQLSLIRFYMERFDTGPAGFPIGMVTETDYTDAFERLSN